MWPAIEPLTFKQLDERAANTERRLRRLFPRLNVRAVATIDGDMIVSHSYVGGFDGQFVRRPNWHPETAVALLGPEILRQAYPRGWARA